MGALEDEDNKGRSNNGSNNSAAQQITQQTDLTATILANASTPAKSKASEDDVIWGTPQEDTLHGGNGKDTIHGLGSDDRLHGDNGDDTLYGYDGDDYLLGGNGDDVLHGGLGADALHGGRGDDILLYQSDMIWPTGFYAWNVGSPGNNISGSIVSVNPKNRSFDGFDGGKGEDTILMTSESDVLVLDDQYSANGFGGYVARIKDVEIIDAGAGNDVVDLTSFTFLYGDVTLYGGAGDDLLWTNAGNDLIYGGAGDDHMDGGVGDDILVVGEGTDQIYGRLGNDMIVYDTLDSNADRIYGFETGQDGDILNLTDILEGYDAHHDDIHDFVSLTQLTTHTALNVNADGDIGGAYTRIAYFQGGISETIDQLLTMGNLVVDQSANV